MGVGEVVQGGPRGQHPLLRDAQPLHIGPVEVHLPVQHGLHVPGKGPHQRRVPGFHHPQGKDPGVVEEVQVVLEHEVAELLRRQSSVPNPRDKGVGETPLPDGTGRLPQALGNRHNNSSSRYSEKKRDVPWGTSRFITRKPPKSTAYSCIPTLA